MITNINVKLHHYQKELIKKLVTKPTLRFNELLIEELESEHMNYHLKQLIDYGFVTKIKTRYALSDSGKDFSNLMDSETDLIEKQPKTSVIIRAVRKNKKGETEFLMTKRLRQPYLGKVGAPTGKVRFGETLQEAAKRELYEETGLTAGKWTLQEVYRKMRKKGESDWVQDVIFYIFLAQQIKGNLIKKTHVQENFWVTKKSLFNGKHDLYDDLTLDFPLKSSGIVFTEHEGEAEGF
jgi:8-oxo-dGTP pyrophosphatase MutT (NUDIX family)